MPLTRSVRNVIDLSDGRGFRFRFVCDGCGDYYDSDYVLSKTGLVSGLLSAVEGLAGAGVLGPLGGLRVDAERGFQSQEKEAAYEQAATEAAFQFKTCPVCRLRVCGRCRPGPDGVCARCVQRRTAEQRLAQFQSQARWAAGRWVDTGGPIPLDEAADPKPIVYDRATRPKVEPPPPDGGPAVASSAVKAYPCPGCKGRVRAGAKFCEHCGKAITWSRKCRGCGKPMSLTAKFCSECGTGVSA